MKRISGQRGQAMIEFALILPLLLLVMFAIFQFGFMFYSYISIQQAAREGARSAAVGKNDALITTAITNASTLDPTMLTISIAPAPATRLAGSNVTVTVTIPSAQLLKMPLVDAYLPTQLTGQATMRMEQNYIP